MPKKIEKKLKKTVDVLKEDNFEISSEDVLVTKEGLNTMKEELEYLKVDGRKKVAERLKEAISFGDLSENSEYEEAKNEQGFIEGRIVELEMKIKNAKIITESKSALKVVGVGSKVTVKNLTKSSEDKMEFLIVGSTEADPFQGRISNESPVGSAFLDKKKGDKIKAIVPAGTVEYEILKIE